MDKLLRVLLVAGLAAILAVAAFGAGAVFGRTSRHFDDFAKVSTPGRDVGDKVDEVMDILDRQALNPPNEATATVGAIQGLLDSTGDTYANYFDAKHYRYFNEQNSGEFGGIGVTIGEKDGEAYVVTVMPDTPAAKAGIKPDDVFVGVDNVRRDKWSSDEIVRMVRGDVGTYVTVTMRRGKDEKTFKIKRATIEVPNIDSIMLEDDIGYVRLYSFNQRSEGDIREEIETLTRKGAKGFILDVRSNPGGLLDEAVEVASLFIENGVIVRVEARDKPEEVSRATGDVATDAPLVLLVNSDSASASEILAGALQDHVRAPLVGEKTFGKGSVQTVEELMGGAAVKFTVAHYLTPKKRVIDGKGVTPEHVVKMDPERQYDPEFQKDRSKDTQLLKAIEVLKDEL